MKTVCCFLFLLLITSVSCTTGLLQNRHSSAQLQQHPEFNVTNSSKVQKGMTPDQVEEIFGKPDRAEMTICGEEKPFPCLIYIYEMGYEGRYKDIMNNNKFYFSKEPAEYWWLYQWDFEYMHVE